MDKSKTEKQFWDESFNEAIAKHAYNTSPVEAVVRSVAYYLRDRFPERDALRKLHFLDMGCGAGPTMIWLAERGVKVSGIDISTNALNLARENFNRSDLNDRLMSLTEASVTDVPFKDESFDGIVEACVFQHLNKDDRQLAFGEVKRLLKPGGLFVGYMLDSGHTVFQAKKSEELADDPGTLLLNDGSSKIHLTDIGLAHFFKKQELIDWLNGFSVVDPCLTTYYIPKSEAKKRGYSEYLQSMWTVYAVK